MSNKTVAIDLDPGNLLWLKAQALAAGRRSMSEVLNQIRAKARCGGTSERQVVKSVVGQARISEDDPDLAEADAAIRALFEESHGWRKRSARSAARLLPRAASEACGLKPPRS